MTDLHFVDTNILVYAHDRSAGKKHQRSRELVEQLWEGNQGVLSTQVLQELCINLRRKMAIPFSSEELRQVVHDYLRWRVVVNTADSVLQALELETRHKLSFWDALILQAAESGGVTILYSEDFSHQQRYGNILAVNPLL